MVSQYQNRLINDQMIEGLSIAMTHKALGVRSGKKAENHKEDRNLNRRKELVGLQAANSLAIAQKTMRLRIND